MENFLEIEQRLLKLEQRLFPNEIALGEDPEITELAEILEREIKWNKTVDILPKDSEFPLIGYSEKWIDLDFNPKGIRECFINDSEQFTSAKWNSEIGEYETDNITNPEYWKTINLIF